MNDLDAAVELWGIEGGYRDVFGHWHRASPAAVQRLVAALASGGRAMPSPGPVAPLQAFQGDGRRHWALSVQLYALRSQRNWGHGDFTDLRRLIEFAAARGAAAIGLNPLHALFPDRAQEASPYAPNSRLFLNPLYIDVEALPEFSGPADPAALDALRAGDLIDYPAVATQKFAALRLAYDRFRRDGNALRRADFESYRREQGDALLRFACFEVLRAMHRPLTWHQWPPPWRNPDTATLDDFRRTHDEACGFEEYLQWNADRQLRDCADAARQCGMAIGLYIDLAVGVHPDGADAWSRQADVLGDVAMGAPPDEFNPAGQDWGLSPFNPASFADSDCAPLRDLLRMAMRHAGAIRIDHALGLNRVFMIPRGMGPRDGVYVRFPFELSLRAIAEESNRARCIVVAEDLGTVPDGFRDTLARFGLWMYRVMMFERDGLAFRPPERYPAQAVATFNTHDLPTLHGWLSGHDLRVKAAIGVDPGETGDARARSQDALRTLIAERDLGQRGDAAAVAALLAATPSRLAVISLEDVLGVADQVNVPGTIDQHPNWRRRVPVALDDLAENATLQRVAEVFAQAGR
jgi:4-alpha-glucanotransferase